MTAKQRITKAERELKAANKARTNVTTSLQVKYVNYRAGLSPEYPDPPGTLIHIRHIDMNFQQEDKDGDA